MSSGFDDPFFGTYSSILLRYFCSFSHTPIPIWHWRCSGDFSSFYVVRCMSV